MLNFASVTEFISLIAPIVSTKMEKSTTVPHLCFLVINHHIAFIHANKVLKLLTFFSHFEKVTSIFLVARNEDPQI